MLRRVLPALVLLFLAAPFAALITATDWRHFTLQTGDGTAIMTSLIAAILALLIIAAIGTPVAAAMARAQGRRRIVAEILVLLPLLTPPLALGILLAIFYGPIGPIAGVLRHLGLVLSNNRAAFMLATIYAALPTYIIAARAALAEVPASLTDVARTLGQSPAQIFRHVTLPLARKGLAAALSLAWIRAIGEFGILLVIAYFPQGMTVKLWVNLQESGVAAVYPLLWIFLLLALPLPLWLGRATRRNRVM
jgi:molybdate/tungstate transport system permease protein